MAVIKNHKFAPCRLKSHSSNKKVNYILRDDPRANFEISFATIYLENEIHAALIVGSILQSHNSLERYIYIYIDYPVRTLEANFSRVRLYLMSI